MGKRFGIDKSKVVSIPKRVLEALNPANTEGNIKKNIVSIPKRVLEALNQKNDLF